MQKDTFEVSAFNSDLFQFMFCFIKSTASKLNINEFKIWRQYKQRLFSSFFLQSSASFFHFFLNCGCTSTPKECGNSFLQNAGAKWSNYTASHTKSNDSYVHLTTSNPHILITMFTRACAHNSVAGKHFYETSESNLKPLSEYSIWNNGSTHSRNSISLQLFVEVIFI